MNTTKIEKLFNQTISSKNIYESVLLMENASGDFMYSQEYGRNLDTPMLMASVTKLFTTTCVLILLQQGKMCLQDKISKYLDPDIISGLHVYKGKDYSFELKIEHLLFQTSGLPDFYLDGAGSVFKNVRQGDFSYSFDDEVKWIKAMKSNFVPGTKSRAYYTDANFDLLGKIIEKVNNTTLQKAFEQYIFLPLNLKNTYLGCHENDFIPHTYYKDKRLERPAFIRSCFAGGGGITTAKELMIFTKAFWGGKLFDKAALHELSQANRMQLSFYPISYAGGHMKIVTGIPFCKKITLVGHSGSTGAFSFYCPDKDLFFVGDIPQIADPSICIRFVMRAAMSAQ